MFLGKLKTAVLALVATGLTAAGLGLGTRVWLRADAGLDRGRNEAPARADPMPAPRQPERAKEPPGRESVQLALRAADAVENPGKKARALLAIAEAQTAAGDNAAALRTLEGALKAASAVPEDRLMHFIGFQKSAT
jgi:hypothetical protein